MGKFFPLKVGYMANLEELLIFLVKILIIVAFAETIYRIMRRLFQ